MRPPGPGSRTPRNVTRAEKQVARADSLEREWADSLQRPVRHRELAERLEKLRQARRQLETFRCQAGWAESRRGELAALPDAIEAEYLEAKAAFDRLDTECDALRPEGSGWVRGDDRAKAWIACQNRVRSERNERLRTMKRKKARHESLRAALAKHAEKTGTPPAARPGGAPR